MVLTFLFASVKYLKGSNAKAGRFILASGGEGLWEHWLLSLVVGACGMAYTLSSQGAESFGQPYPPTAVC